MIIGKFVKMHDEEYIALSFESLGHKVIRVPQHTVAIDIGLALDKHKPDILLYMKWECPQEILGKVNLLRKNGMKTVCWLFDLYFNYPREYQVATKSFFKSDYVFTTDGGNDEKFKELGVNHKCIRQGIFKEECFMDNPSPIKYDVVFVGSESPIYPERTDRIHLMGKKFSLKWFGKENTDEKRGTRLNELYSETKIVIGDSYYSPHYWSNRVVETLGRGGFLIHQEVEGLKEEYPYLVTYKRGDLKDLANKIEYYLKNENERREIVKKNFEWVRDNYTMDKKCKELIDYVNN